MVPLQKTKHPRPKVWEGPGEIANLPPKQDSQGCYQIPQIGSWGPINSEGWQSHQWLWVLDEACRPWACFHISFIMKDGKAMIATYGISFLGLATRVGSGWNLYNQTKVDSNLCFIVAYVSSPLQQLKAVWLHIAEQSIANLVKVSTKVYMTILGTIIFTFGVGHGHIPLGTLFVNNGI